MTDNNIIFNNLPFWKNLSKYEKDLVISQSVIVEYEKGKIIHSNEDKCLGMIYLVSGEIRTYILSDSGREITLFRLHNDDCCVLSASCVINEITFQSQMKAEKNCKVIILSSAVFSKLSNNNIYVRCYMYETLANRFSSVVKAMEQMLFINFDARLATFLMSETERTKKNEIKMTHEQVAMYINSAREVVARTLKKFEKDSIVELKRGTIIIRDLKKLSDIKNNFS